jgi:hypothetical protein
VFWFAFHAISAFATAPLCGDFQRPISQMMASVQNAMADNGDTYCLEREFGIYKDNDIWSALITMLNSDDGRVRILALRAARERNDIGDAPKNLFPALRKLIRDPRMSSDTWRRFENIVAVDIILQLGDAALPALPDLLKEIYEPYGPDDGVHKYRTVDRYLALSKRSAMHIQNLVGLLEAPNAPEYAKAQAAESLSRDVGASAKVALPALRRLIERQNGDQQPGDVVSRCVRAYLYIEDPDVAVPYLVRQTRTNHSPYLASYIRDSIREIKGPAAAHAVGTRLIKLLQDPELASATIHLIPGVGYFQDAAGHLIPLLENPQTVKQTTEMLLALEAAKADRYLPNAIEYLRNKMHDPQSAQIASAILLTLGVPAQQ